MDPFELVNIYTKRVRLQGKHATKKFNVLHESVHKAAPLRSINKALDTILSIINHLADHLRQVFCFLVQVFSEMVRASSSMRIRIQRVTKNGVDGLLHCCKIFRQSVVRPILLVVVVGHLE